MRRMGIAIGCGMVIVCIIAIVTGVCVSESNEPARSYVESPKSHYLVTYEVTGTAERVDVTYQNDEGGISQCSDVRLPWSRLLLSRPGDYVSVLAQNQGDSGTVTVPIYRAGVQFKTTTSYGAYVIASAHGSL